MQRQLSRKEWLESQRRKPIWFSQHRKIKLKSKRTHNIKGTIFDEERFINELNGKNPSYNEKFKSSKQINYNKGILIGIINKFFKNKNKDYEIAKFKKKLKRIKELWFQNIDKTKITISYDNSNNLIELEQFCQKYKEIYGNSSKKSMSQLIDNHKKIYEILNKNIQVTSRIKNLTYRYKQYTTYILIYFVDIRNSYLKILLDNIEIVQQIFQDISFNYNFTINSEDIKKLNEELKLELEKKFENIENILNHIILEIEKLDKIKIKNSKEERERHILEILYIFIYESYKSKIDLIIDNYEFLKHNNIIDKYNEIKKKLNILDENIKFELLFNLANNIIWGMRNDNYDIYTNKCNNIKTNFTEYLILSSFLDRNKERQYILGLGYILQKFFKNCNNYYRILTASRYEKINKYIWNMKLNKYLCYLSIYTSSIFISSFILEKNNVIPQQKLSGKNIIELFGIYTFCGIINIPAINGVFRLFVFKLNKLNVQRILGYSTKYIFTNKWGNVVDINGLIPLKSITSRELDTYVKNLSCYYYNITTYIGIHDQEKIKIKQTLSYNNLSLFSIDEIIDIYMDSQNFNFSIKEFKINDELINIENLNIYKDHSGNLIFDYIFNYNSTKYIYKEKFELLCSPKDIIRYESLLLDNSKEKYTLLNPIWKIKRILDKLELFINKSNENIEIYRDYIQSFNRDKNLYLTVGQVIILFFKYINNKINDKINNGIITKELINSILINKIIIKLTNHEKKRIRISNNSNELNIKFITDFLNFLKDIERIKENNLFENYFLQNKYPKYNYVKLKVCYFIMKELLKDLNDEFKRYIFRLFYFYLESNEKTLNNRTKSWVNSLITKQFIQNTLNKQNESKKKKIEEKIKSKIRSLNIKQQIINLLKKKNILQIVNQYISNTSSNNTSPNNILSNNTSLNNILSNNTSPNNILSNNTSLNNTLILNQKGSGSKKFNLKFRNVRLNDKYYFNLNIGKYYNYFFNNLNYNFLKKYFINSSYGNKYIKQFYNFYYLIFKGFNNYYITKYHLFKTHKFILYKNKNKNNIFDIFQEIFNKYKLKKENILIITNNINNQYINNFKDITILYLIKFLYIAKNEKLKNLHKINLNNFNYEYFNNYINKDFILNYLNKKYNILYTDIATNFLIKPMFYEQANIQILFNITLFSLLRLNKDGSYIVYIKTNILKSTSDIIIILKKYFKSINLYYNEIESKLKTFGLYLICKGFKGISKKDIDELLVIFDKMYKNDPTSLSFNIKDEKIRIKYNIIKKITKDSVFKYPSNILNLKDTSEKYDFIREINEKNYLNKNLYIYKVIEYKKLGYEEDNIPTYIKEHQFVHSYLYAKKYKHEMVDFDKDKYFKSFYNNLDKLIIQDMYEYAEPMIYEFNNKVKNDDIDFKDLDNYLYMKCYEMDIMDKMIKDIKWNKTNKFKYNKYFTDNILLKVLKNKCIDNLNINDTWLDLFIIFSKINIIDKRKKVLNTYHFSDTPTNDINVINYYIKTQTKIKEFNWNVHSINNKKYGLITNYKGDIQFNKKVLKLNSSKNIEHYKDSLKNINLLIFNNLVSKKEQITQLVFMFNNLSKNGNFICKFKLPLINNLEISLLNQMYKQFKKLYLVKPITVLHTDYIYIVGIQYTPLINKSSLFKENILENMLYIVDKYKESKLKDKISKKDYSDKFTNNLNIGIGKVINRILFDKERQMFYIDKFTSINNKLYAKINKQLDKTYIKWFKKFKIKKLNNKDRLMNNI